MNDVTMPSKIIAGAGGGCFRAGAQIQLQHGKTASIETLKEGDEVLAFDEQGDVHLAKITKVHYHADAQPILKVKFWRGETYITPNHWVLNQYSSFVEMGSLTEHDALVDGMGHLRPITGVELIGCEPVWNLTVEPHHTFICDGVRVHNGGHRERYPVIAGAGGGDDKGGGGRAAIEDPDSLQSRAMVSLLDLLGEGEIGGLVSGAQSIFLGDVPMQNPDGSYNFKGVTWESRNGTQGQTPIEGFSDIETPFVVGTQVKVDTPKTVSITNPNADKVRAIVTIPSLISQDPATGDTHGATVTYKFQVSADGNPFVDVNSSVVAVTTPGTVTPELAGGSTTSTLAIRAEITDVDAVGMGLTLTVSSAVAQATQSGVKMLVPEVSAIVQPQVYSGSAWVDYGSQFRVVREAATLPFYSYDAYSATQAETSGSYFSIDNSKKIRFRLVSASHSEVTLGIANIQKVTATSTVTVTGKTRSRYQRHHLITLPRPATNWNLRMVRLTADSLSSALLNDTYFDSYVEVVDTKMSYPNSALVGLRIDSSQFNQIPSRSYLVKGLYISVPSNYDPILKTYVGTWDGTFVPAVSSNPAWILYDLLLSKRYGLGKYIKPEQVDKAKLYQIGRHCDELVPDGFGGMEPRFALNTAVQSLSEAYRLISDITTTFRGMMFWAGDMAGFTQDSPEDAGMEFSQANVVDGVFNYIGSSRKDRHSVALVAWNDASEKFKQKIEYVEDAELVARYGIRKVETIAFGCTSRGQAARVGRWILYTERDGSNMIQFKVGIDAALVVPGEIIKIHDQFKSGKRMAGRLTAVTLNSATLDAPITIAAAGASISIRVPDAPLTVISPGTNLTTRAPGGTFTERFVLEGPGTHSVLTWATPLTEMPVGNAVWMVTEPSLVPVQARVLSLTQDGTSKNTFIINALQHNPAKYLEIETGLVLEKPVTSIIQTRPLGVTELTATTELVETGPGVFGAQIGVDWVDSGSAAEYSVHWRRNNENWSYAKTETASYDIKSVPAGVYTIKVTAYNALGSQGEGVTITHEVTASGISPDVQNLRLNPDFLGSDLPVAWDAVSGTQQYVIQVKTTGDVLLREETSLLTAYTYSYAKNLNDGGPRRDLKISVKAKTLVGESANWTTQTFSNAAPAVPTGVSLEAGPGQVSIKAIRPGDQDLAGMIVWMSTDPLVPMNTGTEIYRGVDNAYLKTGLEPGIATNFRIAFYDDFGTAGIIPSSPMSTTPTATGGITMVTALPLNPAAAGGQLAVFLDVVDPAVRGLYGWNGTAWVFTRDGAYLVANSVTANQMNVTSLSAISANLGTMTAGNITIPQNVNGFIKGGQTGFNVGTGFWMGYDADGKYKWSVGNPAGAHVKFDGTSLVIGGSGVIDYSSVGGTKPPSDATRNVFRGNWAQPVTYVVGDTVYNDGSTWLCTQGHISAATVTILPVLPVTSNTYWQLSAAQGVDGATGASAYTATIYKQNATDPGSPVATASSYNFANGTLTPPAGWLVLQPTTTTTPTWACEYTFSGPPGSTVTGVGSWSVTRIDAVSGSSGTSGSSIAVVEMYKQATTPGLLPTGTTYTFSTGGLTGTLNGWSTTMPASSTTQTYMTSCKFSAVAPADTHANSAWTAAVIVAKNGTNGTNGTSYYTWLKYADTPTTGMSDDPTGKVYMGLAHNKTTATESLVYADYSWSLVKGEDGIGINGDNGITTYTWVKYGTDAAGAGLNDSPTGMTYIGLAFNKTTEIESTVATDYTWSKLQGADGAPGPTVIVTPSRGASFSYTDNTLDAAVNTDITLTATITNLAGATYAWSFTGFATAPTPSSTATAVITAANLGANKFAIATCTISGIYTDKITIVRLDKSTAQAGADSTNVVLQAGTTITGGGVTVSAGGAFNSVGKTWANTVEGFYLGYTGTVGKYGLDIVGGGQFRVRSAASGARMEIKENVIWVYDSAGVVRVKIGDLAAV